MNIRCVVFILFLLSPFVQSQTQSSLGAEIVSYQTFGEGLMVTRAKMAPISGTVSNIFFYNRADEPWNGNVWYEYDWELRGAHPFNGWSQIRVREENGGVLRDAPVNIATSESIGDKFFHYVLIRQNNEYVYDIREDFDLETYDYSNADAHGENSASIIVGGPRVFYTGSGVGDIPLNQRLDFSLGITAFNTNWSGPLPSGSYSGDYVVDFTRFYEFSGSELNSSPAWFDEFNGTGLDYGKWFPATWTFYDTQFTPDNIRFENGYMVLRVGRDIGSGGTSGINLALYGQATQSTTAYDGEAARAIDGVTQGAYRFDSVTHTETESNSWWELELLEVSSISQIVIFNRTDSCCVNRLSDFSVSVLDENDAVIWTQFYTNAPESMLTIELDVTGKKIKINRDGVLSLAEVQVFGEQRSVLNLAIFGEASQSTTAYEGEASRAIDDDTNGIWKNSSVTHTANSSDSWWQVELPNSASIEQIVLFNRTDSCCAGRLNNFTVSILDEFENVVWSQFYVDMPSSSLEIDASIDGKTVKVSRDGVLSLAEVQVFGS